MTASETLLWNVAIRLAVLVALGFAGRYLPDYRVEATDVMTAADETGTSQYPPARLDGESIVFSKSGGQ
jgi:hypothetical protein